MAQGVVGLCNALGGSSDFAGSEACQKSECADIDPENDGQAGFDSLNNTQNRAVAADYDEEFASLSKRGLIQVGGHACEGSCIFVQEEGKRVALEFGNHLKHHPGGLGFFSMGDEAYHAGSQLQRVSGRGIS